MKFQEMNWRDLLLLTGRALNRCCRSSSPALRSLFVGEDEVCRGHTQMPGACFSGGERRDMRKQKQPRRVADEPDSG